MLDLAIDWARKAATALGGFVAGFAAGVGVMWWLFL